LRLRSILVVLTTLLVTTAAPVLARNARPALVVTSSRVSLANPTRRTIYVRSFRATALPYCRGNDFLVRPNTIVPVCSGVRIRTQAASLDWHYASANELDGATLTSGGTLTWPKVTLSAVREGPVTFSYFCDFTRSASAPNGGDYLWNVTNEAPRTVSFTFAPTFNGARVDIPARVDLVAKDSADGGLRHPLPCNGNVALHDDTTDLATVQPLYVQLLNRLAFLFYIASRVGIDRAFVVALVLALVQFAIVAVFAHTIIATVEEFRASPFFFVPHALRRAARTVTVLLLAVVIDGVILVWTKLIPVTASELQSSASVSDLFAFFRLILDVLAATVALIAVRIFSARSRGLLYRFAMPYRVLFAICVATGAYALIASTVAQQLGAPTGDQGLYDSETLTTNVMASSLQTDWAMTVRKPVEARLDQTVDVVVDNESLASSGFVEQSAKDDSWGVEGNAQPGGYIYPRIVAPDFDVFPIDDSAYRPADVNRAKWAWRVRPHAAGTHGIRLSVVQTPEVPKKDARDTNPRELVYVELMIDIHGSRLSVTQIAGVISVLSAILGLVGGLWQTLNRRAQQISAS
jgi:hypothetical protein